MSNYKKARLSGLSVKLNFPTYDKSLFVHKIFNIFMSSATNYRKDHFFKALPLISPNIHLQKTGLKQHFLYRIYFCLRSVFTG